MITPEEKKHRQFTVGGSDLGAILGFSKWSNAYTVYLNKKYSYLTENIDSKPAIVFGNMAERYINDILSDAYDDLEYSPQAIQKGVVRGNLDAICNDCVIEYKTANSRYKKEWQEEGIPATYWVQAQVYMYLAEKQVTHLWCYFATSKQVKECDTSKITFKKLEKFEIKRCDAFIKQAIDIAEEYAKRFLSGDDVPNDYHKKLNMNMEDLIMANAPKSVLDALGIKKVDETYRQWKSIILYGKSGTGKTTTATKGVKPLIIDINERGASVAENGHVIEAKNYASIIEVIRNLPAIKEETKFNVLVIETVGKLRDVVLAHVLAQHNVKSARIQDYGEAADKINVLVNKLIDLQQEYKFHLVFTGHEAINAEKDASGTTINATVSIDVQSAIQKTLTTSVDIIARTAIEFENDENGNRKEQYILSVEPSELYVTKIRKRSNTELETTRLVNASVVDLVRLAETGKIKEV